MEKSKQSKILFRYFLISAVVVLMCCIVIISTIRIVFFEREGWNKKTESTIQKNIVIPAQRGNILSANDEILASTIKEYQLFFDFRKVTNEKGERVDRLHPDTLEKYINPLCDALAKKLGDKTAKQYKVAILKAYDAKNKRFRLSKKWVSYLDILEIKKFPLLEKGRDITGFFEEGQEKREMPFGNVASRTIGRIKLGEAEYGIELAYDSILKGKDGKADFKKARKEYLEVRGTKIDEENGCDVRTTIDLKIQRIAEQALLNKLKEVDADNGCAVVMEVKTGAVRAITNFRRAGERNFVESRNNAIADMVEPGSTFKTVAAMAVLDEGIATSDEIFDTGNGVYPYTLGRHTRYINDWNKHRGGYGKITLAQAIHYSSNIGIAKAVLKGYEKNQRGFIEKLEEMGVCDSVDLKMIGQAYPKVPHPDRFKFWNYTTLPWMSFGYNVQIPPIYTLMFYNAIANNGKMISPIFVSDILQKGKVKEHIEAPVVREQICKPQTLVEIRKMLTGVVTEGTAKNLMSPYVSIAGKTGTAQMSKGGAGYKSGETTHRVSFCGYFPDNESPKYSCIVVVTRPRGVYPSAGAISGEVVKTIAEHLYANGFLDKALPLEVDKDIVMAPEIKRGISNITQSLCDSLSVAYTTEAEDNSDIRISGEHIEVFNQDNDSIPLIPSVIGMGLKDALLVLEQSGVNVKIKGQGCVKEQMPDPGSKLGKGDEVIITLE
ncbi:MAG: transpeptidase family protein [Bacteroidales bacterium]|nr:transpeptidase family protein [Bacteroidales bacterium]MBR5532037.1 transpeptidase family protein [Bacteroidales bacterium]